MAPRPRAPPELHALRGSRQWWGSLPRPDLAPCRGPCCPHTCSSKRPVLLHLPAPPPQGLWYPPWAQAALSRLNQGLSSWLVPSGVSCTPSPSQAPRNTKSSLPGPPWVPAVPTFRLPALCAGRPHPYPGSSPWGGPPGSSCWGLFPRCTLKLTTLGSLAAFWVPTAGRVLGQRCQQTC